MIEFPIKYFEGNLVFAQDGSCWAYYKISGFNYDFLSDDEKDSEFMKLQAFFWQIGADTHTLILPSFQSIQEKHDHFKSKLRGPLKEAAARHANDVARELERRLGKEATEYRFFIGVKLPKPEKEKTKLLTEIKFAFKEFIHGSQQKAGVDGPEVLEDELIRHMRNERRLYSKVHGRLRGEPVTEDDLQWLIRRNWYRGLGKPPHIKAWSPAYSVDVKDIDAGEIKVRRPLYRDVLRLSEGLVDESPGRGLLLQQVVDGEEQQSHVAFLTVGNVSYEITFPGEEWLYLIQTFDFPVEICMRTETMENRKALAAVRNKQKELKDQDRHAQETKNDTSLLVLEGRAESHELEAYLQKSKMPLLKTSIVLCVAADTEDELRRRCDAVKDTYEDMSIMLEQPYGDQWLAFNEFLPGSRRYIKDYIQFMEPGTVAGGMFGATKQLGDGEGFVIGFTGELDQPVYIMPNRAAKGIRGTITNALSMAFLGSLGGGKSMTSNLVAYLSVLSGGKALVVDPKGERGGWAEALPELREHINIITLTSNEQDRGKLDPFSIFRGSKEAQYVALNILTYLTGISPKDPVRFPKITRAVREVAKSDNPSMTAVMQWLLNSSDTEDQLLGEHIQSFYELAFAQLLFGDGENTKAIQMETALNILQIQDLELPTPETDPDSYSLSEMLSVAMLLPISSFALRFIHSDRSQYKIVLLDEAWAILNTAQGRHLAMKLIREGRSMNAGIYLVTQNANDLLDEKMKNNIGMKFAFRSTDPDEIKNILKFMNLRDTEYNRSTIRELQNGECLMQDIYGRCGVVRVNLMFKDLFDAFDTRPPEEKGEEEIAMEEEVLGV